MSNSHPNNEWITEECFRRSVKFFSKIDRRTGERSGIIRNEQDITCQQYRERNPSDSKRNPLRGSEFVVSNIGTGEELVFRKASCLRSVFDILDGGAVVGTIRKRGILRNRYTINISGLSHWIFRIPLFSTRFRGESEDKGSIWVSVGPSKAEWSILVDPNSNNLILISVLAFIHNEYWNHG